MLSLFVKSYTALAARTEQAERGAGMAEYVLLLALVAAVMIAAFTPLVSAMTARLSTVAASIAN